MPERNRETLERFFRAFSARDGETMAACYHADAQFTDPVFTLRGSDVGAMWRMLCKRGRDLRVESSDIQCRDDHVGRGPPESSRGLCASGKVEGPEATE